MEKINPYLLAVIVISFIFMWKPSWAVYPGDDWTEELPKNMGLDPAILDKFANEIGGSGVIIRNGYLVKKWGSYDAKIDWASAAKPVISTMLLFALKEGKLTSVDGPRIPK
jgi:hypothetical protein